jgi:hypothetical protein
MGNVLQHRKEFIPIGLVSIQEWESIRALCKREDVTRGGDYDAPYGGAINIWTQDSWVDPDGELHGTFYPEVSENHIGMVNIYFQTGAYLNANGERPWESDLIEYSWEENWSPLMGRLRFCRLYREAMQREYSGDLAEVWGSSGL